MGQVGRVQLAEESLESRRYSEASFAVDAGETNEDKAHVSRANVGACAARREWSTDAKIGTYLRGDIITRASTGMEEGQDLDWD